MKNTFLRFLPIGMLMVVLALSSTSCIKREYSNDVDETLIENMQVSPEFKFRTTQEMSIHIATLDNMDVPVPNIRIDLYNDLPDNGGSVIMSGMTNENGIFSSNYKIPAGLDSIVVGTRAIGFPNMQKVKVTAGALNFTLGGKPDKFVPKSGAQAIFSTTNAVFKPIGTYNSNGVPNYLLTPNDIIDAATLADINATLPEYQALPTSHPQYFTATNETNLVLTDACDVWVTFVHEGAGYRNIMGFYKFNTNNPPASAAAIDTIFVVFPNVSFSGSGGGLNSGNKVHIGQFAPGTEIGWVIIANGFSGTTLTNGVGMYYSDRNFNPETNPNLRQHTILANDIGRGKFLLGFEDLKRDAGSDNDFNDAIFYVTANPIQAVETVNIPLPNYTSVDADNDGVSDNFDDYPNDATKAFNNYYPAQGTVGTLSFEDLWPSRGDYDFNDLVVDYSFNQITNGQNKAVQIVASIIPKAIGASYNNGFGFQLPISPSQITSVAGTHILDGYIIQNANGTEAGQSKATIIAFDNAFNELPYAGGIGVNTTVGAPYVQPPTLNIVINLASPTALSVLGTPPYNPFMIINKVRGKEVHLVDNPPTDLADLSLLGTSHDNSNPATGRYYVTAKNLPYALDVSGPFDYPIEKTQITQAHLKFFSWGQSNGKQYYDWFKPLSGYRNSANIFTH